MRLPSLTYIQTELREILLRFPVACLVTLVGTVAAYILVGDYNLPNDAPYVNIILTCLLGLPFLLATALFTEQLSNNHTEAHPNPGILNLNSVLAQFIGLALLIGYYFTLPPDWSNAPVYYILQFVLLEFAAHFAVAIAPFLAKGNTQQFWQYNQTLFIRILTAALYSGVLFLGLALALVSIENLFNVNIRDHRYLQLFVILAGIFNTFFFLSGVPLSSMTADTDTHPYPRGLKIFTQYVLLPLVLIYLLILYSYMGKIILQVSLPKGWVSYLVLGFSVAGILAQLLVYPIKAQKENAWVSSFSRWFYFLLIPLIGLLYVAVLRRVLDYGITELRYLLILLTLWLTGITLYFIFAKQKNIQVLPLTLCILAFLSAFGPWGASAVSRGSQQQRLKKILQTNALLSEAGKILPATKDKMPPQPDRDKIASSLDYLYRTHGLASLQPLFTQNLKELMQRDSMQTAYAPAVLQQLMGFDTPYYGSATGSTFTYYATANDAVPVSGYDILVNNVSADFYNYNAAEPVKPITIHEVLYMGKTYQVAYHPNLRTLLLQQNGNTVWSASLDDFAKTVVDKHGMYVSDIPPQDMQLTQSGVDGLKASLLLSNFSGTKTDTSLMVNYLSGQLLIKF